MADIQGSNRLHKVRLQTHDLEMQLQLQRIVERRAQIDEELIKLRENEEAVKRDLEGTRMALKDLGA